MARISRADYDAMREAVEGGECKSVRAAAEKWGHNPETVCKHATRHGWCVQRKELSKIVQETSKEKAKIEAAKTGARIGKSIAEKLEAIRMNQVELLGAMQGDVANTIKVRRARQQEMTPQDNRAHAGAGKDLVQQYLALAGLPTERVEHSGAVGNVSVDEYKAALREALEQT